MHPNAFRAAVTELVLELERSEVSYALGGGLAFESWGVSSPRSATTLHAFVAPDQQEPVLELMRRRGLVVREDREPDVAPPTSTDVDRPRPPSRDLPHPAPTRQPAPPLLPLALHVGHRDEELALDAERTRVRRVLGTHLAWFVSREVLAAYTLLDGSEAGLEDVRRLALRSGWGLDDLVVRRELVKVRGERDPSIGRWDALVVEAHGAV